MALFKVSIVDLNQPNSKPTTEEVHAENEQQLKDLYQIQGYKVVKILGSREEENPYKDKYTQEADILTQNIGIPPNINPQQNNQPPKPKIVEFTHNNLKYKTTEGGVFVFDWSVISNDDYKITTTKKVGKGFKEIEITNDVKIEKLDWIKIEG